MSGDQSKGLRPHLKSKGGCEMCKYRKVKCNEARPACASCIRRNEPCNYSDEPIWRIRLDRKGSPSTPDNSTLPLLASHSRPFRYFTLKVSHESTDRRLLEMRLLHHFITSTVQNKFLSAHDQSTTDIWLYLTPNLAFDHPFLMYAMLSVSALHTVKTQPEAVEMGNTYRVYFDAALSQYRIAVQNLSADNAEAICLATILISLPLIALLGDVEALSYSPPMFFFDLFAGSIPVFTSALPFLPEKSGVRAFIDASPSLAELPQLVNNECYGYQFSALRSWRGLDEVYDINDQNAYDYVLQFVGFLVDQVEIGMDSVELRRIWEAFPLFAPQPFVQGLRRNDSRALILLAYYFSMATSMEDVWWLKGIAEKQVLGIQSILPMEWQWAMAFPLQRVLMDATPLMMPS